MTRYRGVIKSIICIILIIFLLPIGSPDFHAREKTEYNVLYINSYHEGYKWSDDIEASIKRVFLSSPYKINVQEEYLDTQRISDTNPVKYYKALAEAMKEKYAGRNFDAIIVSDDAAYSFAVEYCEVISVKAPLFYCGINDYEAVDKSACREETGILEYIDIKETLEIIKEIHPETKRIHYIADQTLTGKSIEKKFLATIEEDGLGFEYHKVSGKNMQEIKAYVSKLSEGDIVLGTIFFYDTEGNYYPYNKGFKEISAKSSVPMYGLWSFHLGTGIVGGKLLDGAYQGEVVGEMVIQYFERGNMVGIEPVVDNSNKIQFDYQKIQKFNIRLENLPEEAEVINYSADDKKNILLIHSYNQGFQWTDGINQGMIKTIEKEGIEHEFYIEYLDLKRNSNISYLADMREIFIDKYENIDLDMILVSDDGALQFVNTYLNERFNNTPVVFCGVNHYTEDSTSNLNATTGVLESYGIEETIDVIHTMQEEIDTIYVINDATITGMGNVRNINKIIPKYPQFKIKHLNNMSMVDIQKKVSELKETDAILLMTFNKDIAGNLYSYEESISMISRYASVPIYGLWDFYLGDGIVGGYLTSGEGQGEMAGNLAVRVLKGEDISSIPVINESPNQFMFDANVVYQYNLPKKNIPKDAILINRRGTLSEAYKNNTEIFNIVIVAFIFTGIIVIMLVAFLHSNVKRKKKIEELATFDELTGIYNRRVGLEKLEEKIKKGNNLGEKLTVAFIDINNLKIVNDQFGHAEGDFLITYIINQIQLLLKPEDILSRLGGDEIMVVFDNKNREECQRVIKDIRKRIQDDHSVGEKHYEISFSTGLEEAVVGDERDVTKIVENADMAMYENKKIYRMEQEKV